MVARPARHRVPSVASRSLLPEFQRLEEAGTEPEQGMRFTTDHPEAGLYCCRWDVVYGMPGIPGEETEDCHGKGMIEFECRAPPEVSTGSGEISHQDAPIGIQLPGEVGQNFGKFSCGKDVEKEADDHSIETSRKIEIPDVLLDQFDLPGPLPAAAIRGMPCR